MSDEKYVQFIHIPKNAGTYIACLGELNGYSWGCKNRKLMTHPMIKHVPSNHVPLSHVHGIDVYKNAYTFCIIRNPFDKVVSAYKYLGHIKKLRPFNKDSLNEFIRGLPAKLEKNKFAHDGHFLPQYDFIFSEGTRVCDTILSFDNLQNGIEHIVKKYNLKLTKRIPNKINDSNYSSLSRNDLDETSMDIIRTLYAKDFELFKLVDV